jgi:hypothetical protein
MLQIPGLLLVSALASPATVAADRIAFVADDYPRALAEAKAKKVPLFVEVWAPW